MSAGVSRTDGVVRSEISFRRAQLPHTCHSHPAAPTNAGEADYRRRISSDRGSRCLPSERSGARGWELDPNLDLRQTEEAPRMAGESPVRSRKNLWTGKLTLKRRSANTEDLIRLHWPAEAFQGERTQITSFNDRLDLGEHALTDDDLA